MRIKNPSLLDAIALLEFHIAQKTCDFARSIRKTGTANGLTVKQIDGAIEAAIEYAEEELPATLCSVIEIFEEMERESHVR